MSTRDPSSRLFVIVGYLGMLLGAMDPMEGSLLILPASGLVVLGLTMGHAGRRAIIYRVWVCALIAVGVGALWGLSAAGGFGGESGLSDWWGVLVLPYLFGWSMGIWGPGSPRWVLLLGSVVGLWYLALFAMALQAPGAHDGASSLAAVVLGVTGALTIGGCVYRLKNPGLQP